MYLPSPTYLNHSSLLGSCFVIPHYTRYITLQCGEDTRHHWAVSEEAFLIVLRRRVRRARNALGLTQEEVAELADMTLRHYQTFEITEALGEDQREFNPTLKSLRGIAKAVRVSLPSLVAEPTYEELAEVTLKKTGKKRSQ
jgi:transcriptional regulator with XRE-family HTH domain